MEIRLAEAQDLAAVCALYENGRRQIGALGIDQWQNGYPDESTACEDIEKKRAYLLVDGDRVIGTYAFIPGHAVDYDYIEGEWLNPDPDGYAAIHRLAVNSAYRGHAFATLLFQDACARAENWKFQSVRVDTHPGNTAMQRAIRKAGFVYCGKVYLNGGTMLRLGYEKWLNS